MPTAINTEPVVGLQCKRLGAIDLEEPVIELVLNRFGVKGMLLGNGVANVRGQDRELVVTDNL